MKHAIKQLILVISLVLVSMQLVFAEEIVLKSSHDEIRDATRYMVPNQYSYVLEFEGARKSYTVELIAVQQHKENQILLALKFDFLRESGFFANSFLLHADGDIVMERKKLYFDFNRDISSVGVKEDLIVVLKTPADLAAIKKVSKADRAVLRVIGDREFSDYTLTENQKKGMKAVLAKYQELKKQ